MRYFVVNLVCHVVVFAILVVVMLFFLARNRRRKTKHVITYFLPCILAILAVMDMFFICAPRLIDIPNAVSDRCLVYSGRFNGVSFCGNTISVDDETFYINPKADMPEYGDYIKIKYTENSRYVMEMTAATPPEVVAPEE